MAILGRGSKGEEVARLQALLCLANIDAKPIDGEFGQGTERAVLAYQDSKGMPSTGQADEETQEAVGMNQPDTTKIPVPVIDNITVDIVAQMFSRFTPRLNIETYLPEVLKALKQAAMDDRDLVLMVFGTIRAETEGFEPISEKQSKYNTDPGAHPFNRYDNMVSLGNQGRPDGERYRGRGFIQLTGRANYQRYGERLGLGSRLIEEPDLANDQRVAALILAEFIKDKRNLAKYAILGNDMKTARKLVNGGSHGLDRFTETFKTGMRILV
ncbi:MAG: peptidoglycan-binding protein [Proteobacteria bacterium]|nr:peptidoglycan-binding protein [Pseudomonadota bacterium]MBU4295598.1 peptidoglycan-binding protein [Pseudomonadota bacterium]MCG2747354.1 peptidoglycan-binding protein [Desulfobulbaceae bacterium]